jgi:uncharacterized protein (TIGR00369 family)
VTTKAVHKAVADIRNRVHPDCVVCSYANAKGLHLKFEVADDGSLKANFKCDKDFEGYPGILHGGVISSILDGAMGNCMFARGQTTVTVEMTTRFRHPIITDNDATVTARITRSTHPLYILQAQIVQNGQVKATAKGKYYDKPELNEVMEQIK